MADNFSKKWTEHISLLLKYYKTVDVYARILMMVMIIIIVVIDIIIIIIIPMVLMIAAVLVGDWW